MSMTGSLMTFDNNNGVRTKRVMTVAPSSKSPTGGAGTSSSGAPSCSLPSSASSSSSCSAAASSSSSSSLTRRSSSASRHRGSGKRRRSGDEEDCCDCCCCCCRFLGRRLHLNSLWSVWYGAVALTLEACVISAALKRMAAVVELPWPMEDPAPVGAFPLHPGPGVEMTICLGLGALAVVLVPPFLFAAVFKVGNLANDGYKHGVQLDACSRDPSGLSLGGGGGGGLLSSLWTHGGPTAPFLHLVSAFCLLLARLIMEARLIQAGFLPKDAIWRTDLDFLGIHRDRLVLLSFLSSNFNSSTGTFPGLPIIPPSLPTPLPFEERINGSLSFSSSPSTLPPLTTTTPPSVASPSASAITAPADDDLWDNGSIWWGSGPISTEFLNYALALTAYAVRYPSVFWRTSKPLASLLSIQLAANAIYALLSFAATSVLYKVQVVRAAEGGYVDSSADSESFLLSFFASLQPGGGGKGEGGRVSNAPFLLNPVVTLALFLLSGALVLASSLVLYLYGLCRLRSFLGRQRERGRLITVPGGGEGGGGGGWGYFSHCAALCVLISLGVCEAPLLHDAALVYRGSLDGAVLAGSIAAVAHLLLWLLAWLILTAKRRWGFKVRVTVARATVRATPRSVQLLTDVEVASRRHNRRHHCGSSGSDSSAGVPLLVVGNGRAYAVSETTPRKAIMGVVQRTVLEQQQQRQRQQQQRKGISPGEDGEDSTVVEDGDLMEDDDDGEQVYWLRPQQTVRRPVSPKPSPDSDRLTWLHRKNNSGSGGTKLKVTFDDSLNSGGNGSGARKLKVLTKAPKTALVGGRGKLKGSSNGQDMAEQNRLRGGRRRNPLLSDSEDFSGEDCEGGVGPEDDGDYATLRELPLPVGDDEDTPSEDAKLLDSVADGSVTYAATNRDLLLPADYEDTLPEPSPLPPPSPTEIEQAQGEEQNNHSSPPPPSSANSSAAQSNHNPDPQFQGSVTPRCLRRADSGMPHEEDVTPRSESVSTESSGGSPPEHSGHSDETSSGIHSNSSGETGHGGQQVVPVVGMAPSRRSTSVDDLVTADQAPRATAAPWRSFSLQRNVQPPTSEGCGDFPPPPPPPPPLEESTVVIRRKQSRPKTTDLTQAEPFGRSTNMRMTSFTDQPDGSRTSIAGSSNGGAAGPSRVLQPTTAPSVQSPSSREYAARVPPSGTASLPPQHNPPHPGFQLTSVGGRGGCHSFPRIQPQQPHLNYPIHPHQHQHTTLPTHHNGVRIFGGPTSIPNASSFKHYRPGMQLASVMAQGPSYYGTAVTASVPAGRAMGIGVVNGIARVPEETPGHHTFPAVKRVELIPHIMKANGVGQDRDSANFSMASSGDSDNYITHG